MKEQVAIFVGVFCAFISIAAAFATAASILILHPVAMFTGTGLTVSFESIFYGVAISVGFFFPTKWLLLDELSKLRPWQIGAMTCTFMFIFGLAFGIVQRGAPL